MVITTINIIDSVVRYTKKGVSVMPSDIVNGVYVFSFLLFKQNLMAKLLTRAWLFLNAQKCTLFDTNLLYLELN